MDALTVLAYAVPGLLLIFFGLSKACELVESASHSTSFRLQLPASVAGATLLAIASSAPEFFTSAGSAILYGVFEIGMMTIIWSAIFNILVIPGISSIASKKPLTVSKEVVYRDGIGYTAVVFILLLVILDGVLSREDAIVLLILYGLYIHVIVLMARAHRADPKEDLDEPEVLLSWRRIALFFFGGLVVIGIGTHFMIDLGVRLGEAFHVPIVVFAAFIFAPGTSVPDTLVSFFAARRGQGSAAISNVFGSNVFDLTICLAVPVLIVGDIPIDLAPVWPSMIMLIVLQFVALTFVRTKWELSRREGVTMLTLFAIACALFLVFLP